MTDLQAGVSVANRLDAAAPPGPARAAAPARVTWTVGSQPAAGAGTIVAERPAAGFVEFDGIRALFRALEEHLRPDAPAAADGLRRELDRLDGVEAGSRAPFSAAIVFAVVRRISRESHHSALLIQRLAEALVRCGIDSARLRGSTVVLAGFERWDRPSLRTLTLAVRLGGHSLPALVCALDGVPDAAAEHATMDGRVAAARAQFLETVRAALHPRTAGTHCPWQAPPPVEMDAGDATFAIAQALSYQNYERVFLVAAPLLAHDANGDRDVLAELWRLVAIAEINLGWIEDGYGTLGRAAELARPPTLRAFLEYLRGLVATKRMNDPDLAERHYRAGLEILETAGEAAAEDRALEEGWLLNGLALIRALRAKTDAGHREELLREAFEQEMRAYRLASGERGAAFSYLRHNLLANLTFLLQISGRFQEAVDFWRRSFERFLAADNSAFQLGFEYRLGSLLFRSGARADGIARLRASLEYAARSNDPFYEERVAYALAWCLMEDGRAREALEVFLRGMLVTDGLRLAQAYDEHLAGALMSATLCGDRGRFRACCQLAAERPWSTWSGRCLRLTAIDGAGLEALADDERPHLRPPSPKLPSYIPSIDLEGTPSTDLNRYLVMDL